MLSLSALAVASAALGDVSFQNDVMAVLSKAGCNQGTCHGNKNGKGGFKLSLRGEDPGADHLTLTRDLFGRRVDPIDPERSLILAKPTAQVPHEGGKRFDRGSWEYQVLRSWIAGGLRADPEGAPRLVRLEVSPAERILVEPEAEVKLEARAVFSDGSARDAGALAVYETTQPAAAISPDGRVRFQGPGETTVLVRYLHAQAPARLALVPARPGFVWKDPPAQNYIDEAVFAKLRALRMNPSEPASDPVFLRRAHLDLLGLLPTAEEARAFVADPDPRKRARLVDRLLGRPEFADFWALKWADLLRIEEKVLDRKGVQAFHGWIRRSIADGKPLDRFAREILAARGSTYSHPETNFYRALREPLARAEAAAQVFLGVRLQCARCHNHPFDRWTQDDYYGWAGNFARVGYKVLENRRRDRNDGHEFVGEQVVYQAREGEVTNPRTGQPAPPRLLGAAGPDPASGDDRAEALAAWLAGPANRHFPRAQANRIWYHLMGRGLVDPPDDFRATNPPSHPELLEALARDLAGHGFDLRHLIRRIMTSRAYGLSSEPDETNREDETHFARAVPRRLTAEQLLDAQHQALGAGARFGGYPEGLRAAQLPGVEAVRGRDRPPTAADRLLRALGKPPRLVSCECERSGDTTLGQTFQLLSGPALNDLITRPGNRLGRLLASGKPAPEVVDELYWAALSRPPGEKERSTATAHLEGSPDRREAVEDLAWALLNSKEFVLRP